jgi:hypothetical protein
MNKKLKKLRKDCAYRLMNFAIEGFYYFDDDEIEEILNAGMLKYQNLSEPNNLIRNYVFSRPKIYEKICLIAMYIFVKDNMENKNELVS